MTNGCKGCVYHCSDRVTTSYRYCDYYGQTGKTRTSLGVKTDPGGGCSLKEKGKVDRRKPVSIAYGKQVQPPDPARRENTFGKTLKERRRLNPAEHRRRLELYQKGYSDAAIAKQSDVTPGTIWAWRKKYSLPAKAKKGRPKGTERTE